MKDCCNNHCNQGRDCPLNKPISEKKVDLQCEAMQRLASQVRSLLVRLLLKQKDDK
jgi:hypothetical protein